MRIPIDSMIEAAANAERLLRNFGARGPSLREMVKDLADRGLIPKRISGNALAAHRILNRATRQAVTPNEVEIFIWQHGITALTQWLVSQPDLQLQTAESAAVDSWVSDAGGGRHHLRAISPWRETMLPNDKTIKLWPIFEPDPRLPYPPAFWALLNIVTAIIAGLPFYVVIAGLALGLLLANELQPLLAAHLSPGWAAPTIVNAIKYLLVFVAFWILVKLSSAVSFFSYFVHEMRDWLTEYIERS
jgi:hypothetical protein